MTTCIVRTVLARSAPLLLLLVPALTAAAPRPAHAPDSLTAQANAGAREPRASRVTIPSSLEPDPRPAWRPATVVHRHERWDEIVQLPGRIVSLPLVALGHGLERSMHFAEEHGYVSLQPPSLTKPKPPMFSVGAAHVGDRAGLGGAVQARVALGGARSRVVTKVRYAATVRQYNGLLVSVAGDPAAAQYDYSWHPEERFYGFGPDAPRAGVTGYASQGEWAQLRLRRASGDSTGTAPWWVTEVWGGPRSVVTSTTRESGIAPLESVYPQFAPLRGMRADHFVTGVRAAYDTRGGLPHWGRGARLAATAERFGAPIEALSLHSGRESGARFMRYRLEAEGGASFWHDPRTFRALLRVEDQHVLSGADRMLPADYATLGASAGLAGYPSGRFHDLDAVVGRLSYLFPLSGSMEMDLHSEWGTVTPDVWRATRLDRLKSSVGFSVRARWERGVLAAIGMDASPEGPRLSFGLGGLR